jgi:hypothetical protein
VGIIAFTNDDDGITTYYVEPFPSLQSYAAFYDGNINIINEIIQESFDAWARLNPNLKFEQVFEESKADIRIHWTDKIDFYSHAKPAPIRLDVLFSTAKTIGLTESNFGKYDISIDYVDVNCESGEAFISKETVKNSLTHEIGHTLDIGHSLDESNLMYGTDDSDFFDTLGYNIPNNDEPYIWHVGEKKVEEQYTLTGDKFYLDQIYCMYGFKLTPIHD